MKKTKISKFIEAELKSESESESGNAARALKCV